MTKPQRITLSRRKGFNLQRTSLALNGLAAVKVDRTTKWGNPYKAGEFNITAEEAVWLFEHKRCTPAFREEIKRELRGKNLGCWCKSGAACHATALLRIANE